jgi:uncharacterized protein YjbJ (UPF0337 family)
MGKNKKKAKRKAEKAKGKLKLKEDAGTPSGESEPAAEGDVDQMMGHGKQAVEQAKDALKD